MSSVVDFHYPLPQFCPGDIPFIEAAIGVAFEIGFFHISSQLAPHATPLTVAPVVLNQEQQQVHDHILQHLEQTLRSKDPKPLQIIVRGMCGTGKTALLNEVARSFDRLSASRRLAKLACTSTAAALIEGDTLHTWAKIPPPHFPATFKRQSSAMAQSRAANVEGVEYVFVDEYSRLGKRALALLSDALEVGKWGTSNIMEFGGASIVLFGDIGRFPPVAISDTLYSSREVREINATGRRLYRSFDVVFDLHARPASHDAVWDTLLAHVRMGRCTSFDVSLLRSLILSSTDAPIFAEGHWRNATLITSRPTLVRAWNALAVGRYSAETNTIIYFSPAVDAMHAGNELSDSDKMALAALAPAKTGRLLSHVEVVLGLNVIVTLAGRQVMGYVSGVEMDDREPGGNANLMGRTKFLRFPLAAVLFRPATAARVTPPIRLQATSSSFQWEREEQPDISILRKQYMLAPAYAVVASRIEGCTFPHVIADLAGTRLTRCHFYATLSASNGVKTIRLLRDFDEKAITSGVPLELKEHEERLDMLSGLGGRV